MQRRKEWAWSGELFSRPSWGGGQGRVMIRANVRRGAGWNTLDGCTARSLLLATAVAACTYGSVCFFSHIFVLAKNSVVTPTKLVDGRLSSASCGTKLPYRYRSAFFFFPCEGYKPARNTRACPIA